MMDDLDWDRSLLVTLASTSGLCVAPDIHTGDNNNDSR